MRRKITWGAITAAVVLCVLSGLYLYRAYINYSNLQNEAARQLSRIETLKLAQARHAPRQADMQSVSESISFLSSKISGFDLAERSLRSEKTDKELNGWEEWRIEAVCAGQAEDLEALIDSLESAGAYHDMNFTADINNENTYEISIRLSFYSRRA